MQFVNLSKVARHLWQWCERRNIWVFASYIASKQNKEADTESRRLQSNTEIELSDVIFEKIYSSFGNPDIDFFASRTNTKCKKYVSWGKDPESFAIDAFTISWGDCFFDVFPPCAVILKALQKIRNDHAYGIMVVPEWSAQPWYPLYDSMLVSKPFKFEAKGYLIFSSQQSSFFWDKTILVAGILCAKH